MTFITRQARIIVPDHKVIDMQASIRQSLADIGLEIRDVYFAPKSGHGSARNLAK